MKALVLGGAGYIGSVTAHLLQQAGHEVFVIDDLSTGHAAYVRGLAFIRADLLDAPTIQKQLRKIKPDVVLHFAAKIQVAESMQEPQLYFQNNTYGTMLLMDALTKTGCQNIVFSSTAAVYGEPKRVPIQEDDPKNPVNPYGWSKLLSEQLMQSYGQTHGLNWIAFRYFNAAGAYRNIAMNYPVMTHLIPRTAEAVLGRETLQLYGEDYPTPDGTCIRDFVHVADIAHAHVLAAEKMHQGETFKTAVNLANGQGYSVLEVIKTMEKVAGRPVPRIVKPRRAGDPVRLIADRQRARKLLSWTPKLSLEEMVASHLRWRQQAGR